MSCHLTRVLIKESFIPLHLNFLNMPDGGFIFDNSTSSIEEKVSGKIFTSTVRRATERDVGRLFKKDGWLFNWKVEYKLPGRQVYKLLVTGQPEIQGLISLEPLKNEQYIQLHLIENAPHNFGKNKRFLAVAPNMVAFACKMSFSLDFGGYVCFVAKTRLIDHYIETLGAQVLKGNKMAIFTEEAKRLVNSYYKTFI